METALLAIEPVEQSLDELRRQRETLGQPWDRALAALRRGAHYATDEGAPGLYTALFAHVRRAARKNGGKPTPAPQPAPAPAPPPVSTA